MFTCVFNRVAFIEDRRFTVGTMRKWRNLDRVSTSKEARYVIGELVFFFEYLDVVTGYLASTWRCATAFGWVNTWFGEHSTSSSPSVLIVLYTSILPILTSLAIISK
jgi:hypothetical protein